MAQRTFNQINTSPTICDQEDMDMEVQPVHKSKRGRKRQSDEETLTEAERIKKEKNRKAAQKCREKKEKEAKDLKKRNEELERENKKLSDEKKKLEMRAEEFHKIIQNHIKKGCRLPPNVQEVYNEGQLNKSSNGYSEDVELYRAVGTIERDHTPPHTPEQPRSGNLSPHIQQACSFNGGPTALFSGTPLAEEEVTRRKSGSLSRSPSISPALPQSPAQAGCHLPGQKKDLSYFLAHNQVPKALAPISPAHLEKDESVVSWFSPPSQSSVPTVVTEIEEDCKDSTDYISKSYQIINRDKTPYMRAPLNGSMETTYQLPDVPSEDEVAKQLARQDQITHGDEGKASLPSLGFSCIPGYSYTEDLQQMESVEEIIDYTSDVHPANSQPMSNKRLISSLPGTGSSQSQPVVNVSVCAPALLGICDEMSPSLQRQIKTFSNISVPDITQLNPVKNEQNALTQSGRVLTPSSLVSQTSGTGSQQFTIDCQHKLANCLETVKEEKHITVRQDGQHSELSSEQLQEIIKSLLMLKNGAVQNQNLDQPMDVSLVLRDQESHLLSQTVTGLPVDASFVRQVSEELSVQQRSADLLSAGLATRVIPLSVSVPVADVTSTCVQTLTQSLSHRPNIAGTSSYPVSGQAAQSPGTTERYFYVKDGTRIVLVNRQLPEPSSSTTQAPTFIVNPDSLILEATDYSENIQDLPSLNLTELNSDSNLFEKKPSRLA